MTNCSPTALDVHFLRRERRPRRLRHPGSGEHCRIILRTLHAFMFHVPCFTLHAAQLPTSCTVAASAHHPRDALCSIASSVWHWHCDPGLADKIRLRNSSEAPPATPRRCANLHGNLQPPMPMDHTSSTSPDASPQTAPDTSPDQQLITGELPNTCTLSLALSLGAIWPDSIRHNSRAGA